MNIDIDIDTKHKECSGILIYKHHSFPSACLVGDCSGRLSC